MPDMNPYLDIAPEVRDALADGRPGSRHPVSEASPAHRAQEHSVVHEDNPHGDRKLSSGSR